MRGWDNIVGPFNGHRGFDSTEDGVDWSVKAESLLDYIVVKVEFLKSFVGEWWKILAENTFLFLVELLENIWTAGKAENDPGAGGGRRVLAGHK